MAYATIDMVFYKDPEIQSKKDLRSAFCFIEKRY